MIIIRDCNRTHNIVFRARVDGDCSEAREVPFVCSFLSPTGLKFVKSTDVFVPVRASRLQLLGVVGVPHSFAPPLPDPSSGRCCQYCCNQLRLGVPRLCLPNIAAQHRLVCAHVTASDCLRLPRRFLTHRSVAPSQAHTVTASHLHTFIYVAANF